MIAAGEIKVGGASTDGNPAPISAPDNTAASNTSGASRGSTPPPSDPKDMAALAQRSLELIRKLSAHAGPARKLSRPFIKPETWQAQMFLRMPSLYERLETEASDGPHFFAHYVDALETFTEDFVAQPRHKRWHLFPGLNLLASFAEYIRVEQSYGSDGFWGFGSLALFEHAAEEQFAITRLQEEIDELRKSAQLAPQPDVMREVERVQRAFPYVAPIEESSFARNLERTPEGNLAWIHMLRSTLVAMNQTTPMIDHADIVLAAAGKGQQLLTPVELAAFASGMAHRLQQGKHDATRPKLTIDRIMGLNFANQKSPNMFVAKTIHAAFLRAGSQSREGIEKTPNHPRFHARIIPSTADIIAMGAYNAAQAESIREQFRFAPTSAAFLAFLFDEVGLTVDANQRFTPESKRWAGQILPKLAAFDAEERVLPEARHEALAAAASAGQNLLSGALPALPDLRGQAPGGSTNPPSTSGSGGKDDPIVVDEGSTAGASAMTADGIDIAPAIKTAMDEVHNPEMNMLGPWGQMITPQLSLKF